MGPGSLRHASAVTAPLCSTKGTAPGEPIKSVRCAGDSCSIRSPEKARSSTPLMGKHCRTGWEERRWNRGEAGGEKGSIRTAVNLKASRDHGMLERNASWEWGLQCDSMLCTVTLAVLCKFKEKDCSRKLDPSINLT